MVVADTPAGHSDMPNSSRLTFKNVDLSDVGDAYVYDWEKVQELRSGKVTLWDHCFEKPESHFESAKTVQPTVQVGGVAHKLSVGANGALEIYGYPGEFAQRFDGIDRGGGDQATEIAKIPDDGTRTVALRMQEETTPSIAIQGASTCLQLEAGHKFTLKTLAGTPEKQAQVDGDYVLTGLEHAAQLPGFESDDDTPFQYRNTFTCIPAALPFRPPRVTPKPVVHGTQPAIVVGPNGEEIFTDKYGRVKVQFYWDRQGENNADSSCWVRVGTPWAGQNWGMVHIPRIGQEVIVAFYEGDPDQPIIVGSVYNARTMPPYALPDNKTQSGIKSRSSLGGNAENFNEICFEDKKGQELVYIRAEKDLTSAVENDEAAWVGHDRLRTVDNNDKLIVGSPDADKFSEGSQTIEIYKDRTETVKTGNETVTIEQGNRTITVKQGDDKHEVSQGKRDVIVMGDDAHEVKQGNRTVTIDQGNDTHQVKMGNREVKIDMGNDALTISMGNQTTKLDLGQSSTEAMQSIELKVGQSSIKIDQTGVTIKGIMITIEGQAQTQVKGVITQLNGDAMLMAKGGVTMIN
jgi:type VI secretion system secreted protein VgrG